MLQEKCTNLESEKEEADTGNQNKGKTQEEHNNLEAGKGGVDTYEDTAYQKGSDDELKDFNQNETNTSLVQRHRKLPITRRYDFLWMDSIQKTSKKKENGLRAPNDNPTIGTTNPLILFHQNI
jgi:hypothetical protein